MGCAPQRRMTSFHHREELAENTQGAFSESTSYLYILSHSDTAISPEQTFKARYQTNSDTPHSES